MRNIKRTLNRIIFDTIIPWLWNYEYPLTVCITLIASTVLLALTDHSLYATLVIILIFSLLTIRGVMYERRSFLDDVTFTTNRNFFLRYLKYKSRVSSKLALFLIDIENFSHVNDTFGFDAGDNVLRDITCRLKSVFRSYDALSRFADSEFSVFIEIPKNVDEEEFVTNLCERIRNTMLMPFSIRGELILLSVNLGIALYPMSSNSISKLIHKARIALQNSKLHRNSCSIYKPGVEYNALELLVITGSPKFAIANNQLQLHFQPIKDLTTGKIIAVEALSRWRHPSLGIISPDKFVPACERNGSIQEITDWAIEEAVKKLAEWKNTANDYLKISVNVSTIDLDRADFHNKVLELLNYYNVDPSKLVLELTETALFTDINHARIVLSKLYTSGVRVAIDDFGTGNSGLSYLRQLPIHSIKIDRSFITNLSLSSTELPIVKSTIAMAHELNCKVVAEGVEDRNKANLLKQLGCDFIQGYYLSKPVSARRLTPSFLTRIGELT